MKKQLTIIAIIIVLLWLFIPQNCSNTELKNYNKVQDSLKSELNPLLEDIKLKDEELVYMYEMNEILHQKYLNDSLNYVLQVRENSKLRSKLKSLSMLEMQEDYFDVLYGKSYGKNKVVILDSIPAKKVINDLSINDSLKFSNKFLTLKVDFKDKKLNNTLAIVDTLNVKISLLEKKSNVLNELYTNCENKPLKQTKFRLLLGGEVGSNLNLDLTYKINLSTQNAKGNINRLSFQRLNNENYLLIGKDFSIFKINK